MYRVNKVNACTYSIYDEYDDAMYLIVGNHRALCIDCGMSKDSLMDVLKDLTDLPIDLALSHGHLDHAGQSNEFNNVYMDYNDICVYKDNVNLGGVLNDKDSSLLIEMKSSFDLGNHKVDVLPLKGHTPGSVIFIDHTTKSIFTGDALGSGCGVWLQVYFGLSIQEYRNNLIELLETFNHIGINDEYRFYGGHANQEYQSKVSDYNPLCIDLIKDMVKLCDGLLDFSIDIEKSSAKSFYEQSYYASFGKAEMIFAKSQIECNDIDLEFAKRSFDNFLVSYDLNNDKIKLKYNHSLRVQEVVELNCKKEKVSLVDQRLASLIALLHDIGRFEQLRRFNSFDDRLVDHAYLSVDLLFNQGYIKNFIKTRKYDTIIKNAIMNHSLYSIEPALQDDFHCKMIRDGDKLDNFIVKNVESIETLFDITEDEFCNEKVSPNILDDIRNHRLIKKEDRSTHLDMYVSYLAFVFDLNFKSSYEFLKEYDYVTKNIDRFKYVNAYREMEEIKDIINDYIRKKCNE